MRLWTFLYRNMHAEWNLGLCCNWMTDFHFLHKLLLYMAAVFENTYFMFFSDFKKHDFLRFFEMMYQKVVSKSLVLNPSKWVHILLCSVITVIHFPALGVWSILSHCWAFPDVMGTYRHLSHTVLSCIVSCVRISEQNVWCWQLTGTDFRWLCIKGWVIKWPVRFFYVFYVFFKIQKRLFTYFWVVAHVFSNTAWQARTVLCNYI